MCSIRPTAWKEISRLNKKREKFGKITGTRSKKIPSRHILSRYSFSDYKFIDAFYK